MPNRRDIVRLLSDYFTKWGEAIPMKSVDQKEIVEMIKTHIVHRRDTRDPRSWPGDSVYRGAGE